MGTMDTQYGAVTGVSDTSVLLDEDLPIPDMRVGDNQVYTGNRLWEYHNENSIDGIPVDAQYTGLKIDNESLLLNAFYIFRTPSSALFIISDADPDGLNRYNDLLASVYNGEAAILEEDKQYDANKGGYVVWIRYDKLSYVLHPRFKYLLEE